MEKRNVLVFDDDLLSLRLMRSVLEIGNYNVLEAQNVEKGMEIVRKSHPDIILMDHRMPVKNGVVATQELKYTEPNLRILFVSADESIEEEALQAGALGFLGKPIRSKTLLSAIDRIIGTISKKVLGGRL